MRHARCHAGLDQATKMERSLDRSTVEQNEIECRTGAPHEQHVVRSRRIRPEHDVCGSRETRLCDPRRGVQQPYLRRSDRDRFRFGYKRIGVMQWRCPGFHRRHLHGAKCKQEIHLECASIGEIDTHFKRMKVDAGSTHAALTGSDLMAAAQWPLNPNEQRPYVAVATMEDMLVNLHLGEAARLSIYRAVEDEYELIERRQAPAPGGGYDRWSELAKRLSDCRAVLCTSVGSKPTGVLGASGIRVVMMEGLIEEGLESVYAGREVRAPLRNEHRCGAGASCAGDATGCG